MISRSSSCPRRSPRTAAWSCSGAICAGTIWSHGCARRSRDSAATTAVPGSPWCCWRLFYVGARRLEHLRYLGGDPLVTRFCGLARLPTRRTVADWLRQFTQETLAPLIALNRDLVTEALARLELPRLTIDVDGSVIRTGATVGWAFRGFNPHHRKDPSYYPLVAHVAQTGHILRLKNRPGNVHDSNAGDPVPAGHHRRPPRPIQPARGDVNAGETILHHAPVTFGTEPRITTAGDFRFFAGLRSDPFFADPVGAANNFRGRAKTSSPTRTCSLSCWRSRTVRWVQIHGWASRARVLGPA